MIEEIYNKAIICVCYFHICVCFSCTHGWCGDVYPQLDPKGRQPTNAELKTAVKNLPETLMDRWKLGNCADDVIIFYTKKYRYVSEIENNTIII